MTAYRFTRSAREDLIDIWLYTQETWDEVQADVYQDALHLCCERIAAGGVQARHVPGLDGVRAYRCQHHYLFFVEQGVTSRFVRQTTLCRTNHEHPALPF